MGVDYSKLLVFSDEALSGYEKAERAKDLLGIASDLKNFVDSGGNVGSNRYEDFDKAIGV